MTNLQKDVLTLLKEGLTPSQISRKLNRAKSSVSSVIKRFNIKSEEYNHYKNTSNHTYFDEINTEQKAYLLGFFIADGWFENKNNRFGINIQEEDSIVCDYYQKEICNDSIIYKRIRKDPNIKRKPQVNLRWTSKYMKSILINKYKILPNKTYNSNFKFPLETIPEHLTNHFIRGFIDGDGSIQFVKNTLRLILVGTSKVFLEDISNVLCSLQKGIQYRIKEKQGKTINWWVLEFTFQKTNKVEKMLKIYNYLYKDSNCFLQRKKNKFEDYFKYRGKL